MVTRAARRIVHRIRAGGRALGNRRRAVALQGQRSLRVHLGCGDDRLPGFVNIDARPTDAVDVAMDLSLPPLADGSVSLAFSNAFFEHLYRSGREPHLRRIREALAPDGVCCYMGIPLRLSRRRNEVPVTMGFYATREAIAAADLRRRCLSFLEAFADTRIRRATLEWLFTP